MPTNYLLIFIDVLITLTTIVLKKILKYSFGLEIEFSDTFWDCIFA